jgi:MFS family permease
MDRSGTRKRPVACVDTSRRIAVHASIEPWGATMSTMVGQTHVPDTTAVVDKSQARLVAFSGFIGTTVEHYDFFIYGTAAALVFGDLFFPASSPAGGTLLAFSTFAVGYFARPFGAMVLGHFGDKTSRKMMLVFSLTLMGLATVIIGLLPPFSAIGTAAPIILVLARFAQGFSEGGEVAGGITMTVEHAPAGRRGLFGGINQIGTPFGLLLANLAFFATTAIFTMEQFKAYAWRFPFLIGGALAFFGLYVRLRLHDSRVFEVMKQAGEGAKVPLLRLFRKAWKQIVFAALSTLFITVSSVMALIFVLRYATTALGMPQPLILAFIVASITIEVPATLYFGHLSDRIGRRRIYLAALGCAVVWALVFFPLINTAVPALVFLGIFTSRLCVAALFGVQGALLSEQFSTSVRYSGVGMGYALSAVLGAPTPAVATLILAGTGSTWGLTVLLTAVASISLITSLVLLRETYQVDLEANLDS